MTGRPRADTHEPAAVGPLAAHEARANAGPRVHQLAALREALNPVQREAASPSNRTGMPDRLKGGLESLSGFDLSGMRVHYNSSKPAQLNAHAYTQGKDIHVAPGQERHLPHEGWHAVQQMQGRVQAITQLRSTPINDEGHLEREADVMGARALRTSGAVQLRSSCGSGDPVLQAEWIKGKGFDTWDEELDGVTWFADPEQDLLWYEITSPEKVQLGDLEDYQESEGKKHARSYHDWNLLSIRPQKTLPGNDDWQESVREKALVRFFGTFNKYPYEEKRPPQKKGGFDLLQLQNFHRVIQYLLRGVNETKGTAPLNIGTGTDLLYSVGRLSMMINESDYFPETETRALPVNWTQEKFLKLRKTVFKGIDVDTIVSNLGQARSDLLFPSRVEKQLGFFRQFESEGSTDNLRLEFLAPILKFLKPEDLLSLALTNKSFLSLLGFATPATLFKDRPRQEMIAGLAESAGNLFQKPKARPKDMDLGEILPALLLQQTFGKSMRIWSSLFTSKMIPQAGKTFKGAKESDEYWMDLPLGKKRTVPLVNQGSVRLIFTQGAQILKQLGDKSEATDLSYERIVRYLDMLGGPKSALDLKGALKSPGTTENPFFAELAVLLSGIEATQNNMALLQAPMVTDLIASGVLDWSDALFTDRGVIPYFVMAADKPDKGPAPMERHSNFLKTGKLEEDKRKDYGNFLNFIGRELDLNSLFLRTFFPEVESYSLQDQLAMSSLLIEEYLSQIYGTELIEL